jgi:hypothetical protein
MTIKDELHAAVEELTDREAEELLVVVRRLRAVAAWDAAPDDEQEMDDERAAVIAAKAELAAGQGIPWDEVKHGRRT